MIEARELLPERSRDSNVILARMRHAQRGELISPKLHEIARPPASYHVYCLQAATTPLRNGELYAILSCRDIGVIS